MDVKADAVASSKSRNCIFWVSHGQTSYSGWEMFYANYVYYQFS